MRLTMVAHAPVPATRRAAFAAPDEPLLPGFDPAPLSCDRALCGPEARSAQTAAALRLHAGVEVALRDLDAGGWTGRALEELAPDELAAWAAGAAPPGGESVAGLVARVAGWLDALPDAGARAAEHVVAVTHPSVLRAAVVHTLGAPATAFWHVDAPPSARLTLTHDTRRWTLRALG